MKNSYTSSTVSTCPSAVIDTALLVLLLPLTAVTVHVPAKGITNSALPPVPFAVSVFEPLVQVQVDPAGYVTPITAKSLPALASLFSSSSTMPVMPPVPRETTQTAI